MIGSRDRGVSIAVSHALTIAITTLVISGLVIAAGGIVRDQREQSSRQELRTIGERLVTEIARVDTLAGSDARTTVSLRTDHPLDVAGSPYHVHLSTSTAQCSAPPCLVLRASGTDVVITLDVVSDTPVADSTATGGRVVIVYDGSAIHLETGGRA